MLEVRYVCSDRAASKGVKSRWCFPAAQSGLIHGRCDAVLPSLSRGLCRAECKRVTALVARDPKNQQARSSVEHGRVVVVI